jgi:hypothetical protein
MNLECKNCGSRQLLKTVKDLICTHCESIFSVVEEKSPAVNFNSSIQSDIQNLLLKCREDPENLRKYANLILDIDPTNKDVHKFFNKKEIT